MGGGDGIVASSVRELVRAERLLVRAGRLSAGFRGIPVIRGMLGGVSSGWAVQGPRVGIGMSQGARVFVLASWHVLVYRWAL